MVPGRIERRITQDAAGLVIGVHTQRFTFGVSEPLTNDGGSSTRAFNIIKAALV